MIGERPRLLLVEDHLVNEQVMLLLLRRMGCDVVVARDGEEAVELAHQAWDLILMDCGLPKLDGFEATRRIRMLPIPRSQVPIVAVTAYAAPADEARCVAAGMNGWLPKPIDADELASVLELYLGWSARAGLDGADPLLDAKVVQHLAELGEPDDPGFFGRLVESFRKASTMAVDTLDAELDNGQEAAARATIHRLKSSASTIGARRLRLVCEAAEAAQPLTAAACGRLRTEVVATVAALDDVLAGRAAWRA